MTSTFAVSITSNVHLDLVRPGHGSRPTALIRRATPTLLNKSVNRDHRTSGLAASGVPGRGYNTHPGHLL